jgi:NitT/TauT family transport system substrate-binding protein
MTDGRFPSRHGFLAGSIATSAMLAALPGTPAGAAFPPPEKTSLKIGTAVAAMSFMPIFVAAAKTWKAQGLDVQVFTFRGDAEVAQALVGGSIDISVQSLNGFINMITAGQPMMGFYAGFSQADFSWISQPNIKHWSDLKGKNMGIATYGSLTDALSRYVIKKNHLEPEKDVQMIQAGSTPSTYQALKAGKLAAGILSPPFSWQAQDEGLTVLGTQDHEVAHAWPKHMIGASTKFIAENPRTCEAVLRGHVNAIRLARSNRDAVVPVLMDQLKLTKAYAERALDVELPFYDERGNLPAKSTMSVFWDISEQLGDVKSPWEESKFLDRRFMNSFKSWAP